MAQFSKSKKSLDIQHSHESIIPEIYSLNKIPGNLIKKCMSGPSLLKYDNDHDIGPYEKRN